MGVGRLLGPVMRRVVLGGVAFHMEKTLKLPSSLSLFHELQDQALSGSEISHNDSVGVGVGVGGQLPPTISCIPGGILPEKKTLNISPLSRPGSQAEMGESISQG